MAENNTKMCRICLTSDIENNISDSSYYAKFFIQVMCLKEFNEKLLLCIWCKAALRRAMAVVKLALESEKTKQNESYSDIRPKRLYTLNLTHNSHIDIPPLLIEYQDYKTENIIQEMINPLLDIQNNDEVSLRANRKTMKSTEASFNEQSIPSEHHAIFENGTFIKKRSKKTIQCTDIINEESISNIEHDNFEKQMAVIKRKNKKTMKTTDMTVNAESISNLEQEFVENGISTKKRKKQAFDFNNLKFEVEYLNFEEQLKELEFKKLKYKDFKFQCDECGIGFITSDVFEEHKARHSKLSGDYKCSICGLHFKSRDVLSQHSLAHRRRYRCTLCAREFTRWSHCVAHSYKCGAVVTPTSCAHCAKLFSNEYALKIHMKVHKTEKKYCCDQCDRKFASKQRLTVHLRSHSGIKPFSCLICARSFATRSNLRAHSAVHDPTSQFYCVECHSYYKTEKSLKRHFKESANHVGLNSNMYSCKDCSKKFPTEKSLHYHINTRHTTEHRCTQCDKTFSNNSNLNKHIKCIHTAK